MITAAQIDEPYSENASSSKMATRTEVLRKMYIAKKPICYCFNL